MFSMKKEREQEKKTQNTPTLPPPRPVRSNPMEWKLLGPAYMSHIGCATQALLDWFSPFNSLSAY